MRPGSEKEGISRIVLGTVIGCGCGLLSGQYPAFLESQKRAADTQAQAQALAGKGIGICH